jgi:hypothetical protein
MAGNTRMQQPQVAVLQQHVLSCCEHETFYIHNRFDMGVKTMAIEF